MSISKLDSKPIQTMTWFYSVNLDFRFSACFLHNTAFLGLKSYAKTWHVFKTWHSLASWIQIMTLLVNKGVSNAKNGLWRVWKRDTFSNIGVIVVKRVRFYGWTHQNFAICRGVWRKWGLFAWWWQWQQGWAPSSGVWLPGVVVTTALVSAVLGWLVGRCGGEECCGDRRFWIIG